MRTEHWDGLHRAVLAAVGRPHRGGPGAALVAVHRPARVLHPALDPEEFVILNTPLGRFVQLMVQEDEVRAETVSNQYLPESHRLPFEELDVLSELYWNPPTHRLSEDAFRHEGSPNHWVDFDEDTPVDVMASLLVATCASSTASSSRRTSPTRRPTSTWRIVIPTLGLSRTREPLT